MTERGFRIEVETDAGVVVLGTVFPSAEKAHDYGMMRGIVDAWRIVPNDGKPDDDRVAPTRDRRS